MTRVWIAHAEDGSSAARLALSAALASMDIAADAPMEKTSFGKPALRDFPGVHFNLSHSGALGVCALSRTPVGADVEFPRPVHPKVAQRFFTPEEQAALNTRPAEEFFRLWTRKESFAKAIGRGLTLDLRRISLLGDRVLWEDTLWYLHSFPLEAGFLTVCSQSPETPRLIFL